MLLACIGPRRAIFLRRWVTRGAPATSWREENVSAVAQCPEGKRKGSLNWTVRRIQFLSSPKSSVHVQPVAEFSIRQPAH